MKKQTILCLALALLFALFAGCGSNGEEYIPADNKPEITQEVELPPEQTPDTNDYDYTYDPGPPYEYYTPEPTPPPIPIPVIDIDPVLAAEILYAPVSSIVATLYPTGTSYCDEWSAGLLAWYLRVIGHHFHGYRTTRGYYENFDLPRGIPLEAHEVDEILDLAFGGRYSSSDVNIDTVTEVITYHDGVFLLALGETGVGVSLHFLGSPADNTFEFEYQASSHIHNIDSFGTVTVTIAPSDDNPHEFSIYELVYERGW